MACLTGHDAGIIVYLHIYVVDFLKDNLSVYTVSDQRVWTRWNYVEGDSCLRCREDGGK